MNELTLGIFEVVPKSAYTTGSVRAKDSGCLFSNRSKSRERHGTVAVSASAFCTDCHGNAHRAVL